VVFSFDSVITAVGMAQQLGSAIATLPCYCAGRWARSSIPFIIIDREMWRFARHADRHGPVADGMGFTFPSLPLLCHGLLGPGRRSNVTWRGGGARTMDGTDLAGQERQQAHGHPQVSSQGSR
jgi:hypothetical protein